MWFIGVEVGQETSAPPPKKILDPPLVSEDNLGYDYLNHRQAAKAQSARYYGRTQRHTGVDT